MLKRAIFTVLAVGVLTGCSSAYLAGPDTRRAMLRPRVEQFTRAVYRREENAALELVDPSGIDDFYSFFAGREPRERIISLRINGAEIGEQANDATVDIAYDYISPSKSVVHTRTERQTWTYNATAGGWVFKSGQAIGPSLPVSGDVDIGAN